MFKMSTFLFAVSGGSKASNEKIDLAIELLNAGVNVNEKDEESENPLHLAIKIGR